MSVRDQLPRARVSTSHYFLTLSRGEKMRCLALKPWHMWTFATLAPIVAAVYLGATAYLVFRDDMLAALMARQTEMQFAYEDRLAAMRSQIDRVTSRQLLDQDSVEGKVQGLAARQAQLENRASMMAMLAENAGVLRDVTGSVPKSDPRPVPQPPVKGKPGKTATPNPLLTAPQKAPTAALGFAPLEPALGSSAVAPPKAQADSKPHPEALELGVDPKGPTATGARAANKTSDTMEVAGDPDLPMKLRLGSISTAMDRLELAQIRTVSSISGAAKRSVQRLKVALAESGLPADKLTTPPKPKGGVGGPFIPMKLDPKGSPFEAEVARLQDEMLAADSLHRVLPYIPLRKPLPEIDQTSGFGARVDPFLGRMGFHPGIDLREAYGTPVRATADGTIDSAGYNGGYGNMVDIDHGNGVVTRYGHMSSLAVSAGQTVHSGDVVGYLGSTGRSTGPHLH